MAPLIPWIKSAEVGSKTLAYLIQTGSDFQGDQIQCDTGQLLCRPGGVYGRLILQWQALLCRRSFAGHSVQQAVCFKIVDPKNVLCPVSTIDSTVHKTDSVKKTDSIVIRVDSDCPQNQLGPKKKKESIVLHSSRCTDLQLYHPQFTSFESTFQISITCHLTTPTGYAQ